MKQAFDKDDMSQRQDRLLTTLEGLLELSATEVKVTLDQATSLIAEVLAADKVDLFFHDPASSTLVALGTSNTPMGRKQHTIALDRLPLANGGRTVEVFLTGTSYLTHHAHQDPVVRRVAVAGKEWTGRSVAKSLKSGGWQRYGGWRSEVRVIAAWISIVRPRVGTVAKRPEVSHVVVRAEGDPARRESRCRDGSRQREV